MNIQQANDSNGWRGMGALFQEDRFCVLWVAKVHHLIQQFVNHNEIVTNRLFFDLVEILAKNLQRA
jgi:hypothetical protein